MTPVVARFVVLAPVTTALQRQHPGREWRQGTLVADPAGQPGAETQRHLGRSPCCVQPSEAIFHSLSFGSLTHRTTSIIMAKARPLPEGLLM